ncbi:MAG: hypothetical protein ACR2QV_16215 [Gammaproteobacteria bacterium]
MKTRTYYLAIGSLVLASLGSFAHAGPTVHLLRNERFCDVENLLCMHGSLRYEVNPRLFRLWGRVQTSPGRGLLRIRFAGSNNLGHRRTSAMEVQLRGNYSEIVNFRMIPDHPDIANWQITTIEFEPGQLSPPKESRRSE